MIGWLTERVRWPRWWSLLASTWFGAAGGYIGWKMHRPPPRVVCAPAREKVVTVEKMIPAKTDGTQTQRDREKVVTRYVDREGKPVEVIRYVDRDVIKREVVTLPGKETVAYRDVTTSAPPAAPTPPPWLLFGGGATATFDGFGGMGYASARAGRVFGLPVYVGGGGGTVRIGGESRPFGMFTIGGAW